MEVERDDPLRGGRWEGGNSRGATLTTLFSCNAAKAFSGISPPLTNKIIHKIEIEERIQQLQLLTSNSTVARPSSFFSSSLLAELAEKGKAGSSGNQENHPLAKPNYLGRKGRFAGTRELARE